MSLPSNFFEPSFRHRRLSSFLAVIMAVVVYVVTFVTAAETALSAMTFVWNGGVSNRLTVEIPALDDDKASLTPDERVRQAIAIIEVLPEVARVAPVKEEEALRLLKPWIKDEALLKALPMPSLIDVDRKAGSRLTDEQLQKKLEETFPNVRIEDHAEWLSDASRIVEGIAAFGLLMILLSVVTLVLVVGLVCRAVMATEKETIALLHQMGAEDEAIARHFGERARRASEKAALIGFLAAIVCVGILLFFMRNFADPHLLHREHWILLATLVLVIPIGAIGMASLSARLSALAYLRSMP